MNGLHAAIIMDGNGRWANRRGLPRAAGHRAGAAAVRRTIEAAPELGISTLTLYAFSEDNWSRPAREVSALMKLLGRYLTQEANRCVANGVRLEAIGRRDRLPAPLVALLEDVEGKTARGTRLHLRLAIDYSSRQAILDAACRAAANVGKARTGPARPAEYAVVHDSSLVRKIFAEVMGPDVDLLIRTSGEQRLSDFLLWECAYAEMIFTSRMWPDFTAADLAEAVTEFHRRERRFGAVAPAESTRRTA
jgi:undecaprenyl diphosphate synthase